jgi:hypothetical protein
MKATRAKTQRLSLGAWAKPKQRAPNRQKAEPDGTAIARAKSIEHIRRNDGTKAKRNCCIRSYWGSNPLGDVRMMFEGKKLRL